jgi:pimeloyl-ACP methyl ester carboxylesterase
MRSFRQSALLAALLLQLLPLFADDVITNVMSPFVSYQYPDDFGSEALTNGGVQSPIVSFQYAEDFGSQALTNGGVISPFVSYQYLEDFSSAALTNGGIMSPILSYQYYEWPGDSILGLQSSPMVSYFYPWGVGNLTILMQPVTQHAVAGASVTFSVGADGPPPLYYQWQFNGQIIPNATNAVLTLNSVTAADSGGYSVLVWNGINSVVSATASLAVLTEGANGTQPSQQVCPSAPSPSSQDSLVVVTHGFLLSLTGPPPMPAWVTTLANCIQADAPSWSVTALDWRDSAWGINPELALTTGGIVGSLYGQQLAQQQWQRVHLIGHSAGGAVTQAIADQLRSSPSPPVIQMTFLDPYLGMFLEESGFYGQNANWADCYFTQDWTGGFTSGNVNHAYNVDVDWADPNRWLVDYGPSQVAFSTHEYSHDFYIKSVTNIDPEWCGKDYGFRLSAEGGGEANQASHPVGNGGNPTVLCGPPGTIPTPNLPLTEITTTASFTTCACRGDPLGCLA